RVVRGEARGQTFEPLVVAQDVEIGVGERPRLRVDDGGDLRTLDRISEAQPGGQALLHRLIATRPAEDEHDCGEHVVAVETVDDLHPTRRAERRGEPTTVTGAPRRPRLELRGGRVRPEVT